jgi:hypothetical protein
LRLLRDPPAPRRRRAEQGQHRRTDMNAS